MPRERIHWLLRLALAHNRESGFAHLKKADLSSISHGRAGIPNRRITVNRCGAMKLVKDDLGCCIDGPDSERARIAYASQKGGRISYTCKSTLAELSRSSGEFLRGFARLIRLSRSGGGAKICPSYGRIHDGAGRLTPRHNRSRQLKLDFSTFARNPSLQISETTMAIDWPL